MRAAKELIRHKLMGIAHTKSNWWIKWQVKQVNPRRNLFHHTKHDKKSKENWEVQNACSIMLTCLEWPIFCAISCLLILECPRVSHSFSFWQKRIPWNFIVLKQNYCPRAFQREKEGLWSCFQSCQSAPYLVDSAATRMMHTKSSSLWLP